METIQNNSEKDDELLEEASPTIVDVDADLVARCQKELPDKTDAFYELVKKYEAMVYSTCNRMLGDPSDAEECTQDTFLKIFRSINQFEGRSTFKTWMFRILYNNCITRRKKLAQKRDREEVVSEEFNIRTNEAHRISLGPDTDDSEYVHLALNEMREEDREIMELRFISDLSLEEIADFTNAKLSATKMRLYRAMEKFKVIYLRQQRSREDAPNVN